eukprot:8812109-Pyramimonas_sp.AAC.1
MHGACALGPAADLPLRPQQAERQKNHLRRLGEGNSKLRPRQNSLSCRGRVRPRLRHSHACHVALICLRQTPPDCQRSVVVGACVVALPDTLLARSPARARRMRRQGPAKQTSKKTCPRSGGCPGSHEQAA